VEVWRHRGKVPEVFVTTRVIYGDRPAGCVAMAAIRETAQRIGAGREVTTWFLKSLSVPNSYISPDSSFNPLGKNDTQMKTEMKKKFVTLYQEVKNLYHQKLTAQIANKNGSLVYVPLLSI
jgi:hypothetical protein